MCQLNFVQHPMNSHIQRSIRLPEAILVAHVQIRRVFKGVPELINEVIGQNLLDLGVICQAGDDLDRSLHNHRLIIDLGLALHLVRNDFDQSLDI